MHAFTLRSRGLLAAFSALALMPAACAPAQPAAIAAAERPDPASILQTLADRYRSVATYEDTGTIVRDSYPEDGGTPERTHWTFRTAFDRASGGFRFEVTKTATGATPTVYELSRASEGPLALWSSVDSKLEVLSPETGLFALKGVSASTSYDIPSRLFGAPMDDPPYVVEGEDVVGGERCFRLIAREPSRTETLWIGAADHEIHRRHERARIDPNTIIAKLAARSLLTDDIRKRLLAEKASVDETTIDYEPRNDRPLERERFEATHAADATGP
jgi:hypothetical protein